MNDVFYLLFHLLATIAKQINLAFGLDLDLHVLDIEEIKSLPHVPLSQDYVSYCTSLAL